MVKGHASVGILRGLTHCQNTLSLTVVEILINFDRSNTLVLMVFGICLCIRLVLRHNQDGLNTQESGLE